KLVEANVNVNLTWDNAPQTFTTRAYQYNVTLDGEPVIFQEMYTPGASVVVTDDSPLAKAFAVDCDGERVYNLKNITGSDPFGGEEKIKAAAKAAGLSEDAYFGIPTKISVSLDKNTIQSGSDEATLTYKFASYPETEGTWSFAVTDSELAGYVSLKDNGDGTVTVEGTNSTEDACKVVIEATHSLGLKAAVELVATPSFIEAPSFTQAPALSEFVDGSVSLNYALDLGHKDRVDQSVINWYRVKDASGSEPFAVSVTRLNNPETSYVLSPGDVGYYIMATIQPKHQRCYPGEMVTVISSRAVTEEDVKFEYLETDFQNLPIDDQPLLIPGTWSLDG
ncbi:MAG: hypothetical protein HUK24_07400, partial [Sphaerochaetaceae bacterium]|nr:hypothetical protein [Sphaerochaetaceae bacterium]